MVCIFLVFNIQFMKLELSLTKPTRLHTRKSLIINFQILLFNNNTLISFV